MNFSASPCCKQCSVDRLLPAHWGYLVTTEVRKHFLSEHHIKWWRYGWKFTWCNYCTYPRNIKGWNTPSSTLDWARSCREATNKDDTRIWSSTIWGRGGSRSLAASATTTTTCHWTIKQVTLDATIVDGSNRECDGKEDGIRGKWYETNICTLNVGDINFEMSGN